MLLPVFLFLLSFVFIFQAINEDGTPIYRDISLKGGLSSTIMVDSDMSEYELSDYLFEQTEGYDFDVSRVVEGGQRVGYIVDTDMEEEDLKEILSNLFETEFEFGENYSSNYISPTLSAAFFQQAVTILIVSFVFMSTVVFIAFRKFLPSIAVVISAAFDIIVTIGVLNAMRFDLSIAGVGALLMIIGYSIDTDVLLTNRLFKEKEGSIEDRFKQAFNTGLLMTTTTLIAGIGTMIITNSEVIFEIAVVLVVGLLVDFISTWYQNSGMLLWWLFSRPQGLESKREKKKKRAK